MNADRLLALYEQVVEAPDAVSRLRRFVLDLAVRGKLVTQDAGDEPASELLKRIAAEKASNGKRQKEPPEIDPKELDELPPDWSAVPLIALGEWAIGSGFPKNEQGQTDGPYFFLKVSDMNLPENEKFVTTANNFIDEDAAKRMRAAIHPPGTIIFPKIGGAIATNKRRILTHGSAIDNNCLGISFSSHIETEWAYLLMTTLDFTLYQAGTAVPALQQGTLAAIPVPLPPLAEQHRIVAKVDELMALLDRLEAAGTAAEATRDRLTAASLARLTAPDADSADFPDNSRFVLATLPALTKRPDQIKPLRQTILDLAVRGKLVPQDPGDEPASELLKRIAAEKARLVKAGEIRKPRAVLPLEPDDLPFLLPRGWAWTQIAELGIISPRIEAPDGHEASFVPMPMIASEYGAANGHEPRPWGEIKKGYTHFAEGDVGLAKITPCFENGKSTVFRNLTGGIGTGTTELHVVRPLFVDADYVVLFLKSPHFIETGIPRMTGTAGQKRVPTGYFTSSPFPLPPLAEQHRIMARVDALMGLCDRLTAALTAADTTRARLFEALLCETLAPTADPDMAAAE